MNIFLLISMFFAFISLIVAFVLEGGTVSSLLQPTAALIVFGGTFGAIGVSFSVKTLKKIPKLILIILRKQKSDRQAILESFVKLSNKIRKEGLLSLEVELRSDDYDPLMVTGLQLVIDGIDAENIKKTLEVRMENIDERHEKGIAIFEAAGGYAPTMGVIGTVMGLVHVLGNLNNPDTLGPQIAVAFIATLYGVGSANLMWLPIANQLKEINAEEIATKSMITEGVIMIQEGSNPTLIQERLRGYLENEEKVEEIRE